jgi:monoamine oxidase
MGGLSAGLHLKDNGIEAQIYEGSPRVGGRVLTARNLLGEGITTEIGAEFIDSTHSDLLRLAKRFGLSLNDIQAPAERGLCEAAWYFGNTLFTDEQVIAELKPLVSRLARDARALKGGSFTRLDRMSLGEYLEAIGCRGWLRALIEVAYVTEYGLDPGEQSSLNLIYRIGTDLRDGFKVYGESDERYRILGGNQQVPDAVHRELERQVHLGHRLLALRQNTTGGYTVTFSKGPDNNVDVEADAVIIAIPFTILRQVELKIPMPAAKKRAIAELGYGTNVKIFAGYTKAVWRDAKQSGNGFTDLDWQTCWDNSRGQGKAVAGVTYYLGGKPGAAAESLDLGEFLGKSMGSLESVFPGLRNAWTGKHSRMFWPGQPFVRASYSCYKPGQWKDVRGQEASPVGNVFFAGEHCSLLNQGYMDGAAETGRKAAEAILKRRVRRAA